MIALCLFVGTTSIVQAGLLTTEPIQPNSGANLWRYSYLGYNAATNSSAHYTSTASEYNAVMGGATHQGYVTGNFGPWPSVDSWTGGNSYRDTQIFETYITSSRDQIVRLSMGGDDGHSIFVDDTFSAGAGFGIGATNLLSMVADETYKLSLILNNYTGPWHANFSLSGENDNGRWGGSVAEAVDISMNSSATSVPEPAGVAIFAGALACFFLFRVRKQKSL